MFLPELALLYFKATRMKSVRYRLTLRETKSLQQAAIKHAESGQRTPGTSSKFLMDMKMKFSLVHSTTKVIQLSRAQKTTPAEFGRIKTL